MKEMSTKDNKLKSKGNVGENTFSQLFKPSTLHPLILTLMLHLVQNWCGFNVIIFKGQNSNIYLESSLLVYHIIQLKILGNEFLHFHFFDSIY